ncbi:delta-12 fatty acid desaturase [Amylostereum chailletii]|nr:delta-12 fatty acid desaturase [Amylostereum chailletii]
MLSTLLVDSEEYQKRVKTDFSPPKVTLAEIHAAVPKYLFHKSTKKAFFYTIRTSLCSVVFYQLAMRIDPFACRLQHLGLPRLLSFSLRAILWATYCWWQGIAFAGLWCLGHEAGHGTLSNHDWVNHCLGYLLHTFLMVPYFSWRATHHAHHKAVGSIERDENYVPPTRSDYALPPASKAHAQDYHAVFEETPAYTLGRMLLMQLLGWQTYLLCNTLGSRMYPAGTNHFSPNSPLFKPEQRRGVVLSNIGLSIMACLLHHYARAVGPAHFALIYLVPYLLANHWIVMLTFLHHSDPTIPHYRTPQWSFLRGALATVDRPLLGWAGRFFLHNVSHDHIAHHLFSSIPFYNQPRVTEIIRPILGEDYNYDSTNTFRALYRAFTQCCFVEEEEAIAFYRNRRGEAARRVAVADTGDKVEK